MQNFLKNVIKGHPNNLLSPINTNENENCLCFQFKIKAFKHIEPF